MEVEVEAVMEVEAEVEEFDGMTMEVAPPAIDEAEPPMEIVEADEKAVSAFEEPDPGAISEADRLIEAGQYVEAMEVYNKILKQVPDHGQALQKVQELRLLMKVQGKGIIDHHPYVFFF